MVKTHLETKNYSESDLYDLKKVMANHKEYAVDRIEKSIKDHNSKYKDYLDNLIKNVEQYFNFNKEIIMGSIAGVRNDVANLTIKNASFLPTSEEEQPKETTPEKDVIDWTEFMDNNYNDTETHPDIIRPKTFPERYHHQKVRLSSQTEERLRELIDELWQKAYIDETDEHTKTASESAYERLVLIHRNLSAMLIKAHRGMWRESVQVKFVCGNIEEKGE